MAKLEKLHISGIRSFGPFEDDVQQLKFLTPLTLILGQNGCGKTTIIESIKYACTGELPAGTDNGKGFVHDPKMNKSSFTKGQIKLKITDPIKNKITITRIVELTQSAGGTQKFATKSVAIRTEGPDGSDRSLPGRCADVTTEFCQFMNVSQAVLNNVIFCHQENSAWPLNEGKKLKEKFDEIFEAERYKSCIDEIRKQIKNYEAKVKIYVVEVKYMREKKQEVEKTRRVLQSKEESLEELIKSITIKNERLMPVKQRIDDIFELEKVLSDLQHQLTKMEATKKGVIEEQNTLKGNIPFIFEGSDEQLEEKIKSFDQNRINEERSITNMDMNINEIENKIKLISNSIQQFQTLMGTLSQQKKQHENKCTQRKNLIKQALEVMEVDYTSDYENNENAKNALDKLKIKRDAASTELAILRKEYEAQESSLQKNIDDARDNCVRTKQDLASKLTKQKNCENKIEEIKNDLFNISSCDEMLKNYKQKIENIEKSMYNLSSHFKLSEETQTVETSKKGIRDMEDNLEKLETDYKTLQQNDIFEGKMETEKQLIIEKQKEINKIKSKHSNSFKQLFGDNFPQQDLKELVLSSQTKADDTVKVLTVKINKTQNDITSLQVEHKLQVEKIQQYEKELKMKQEQILQVCNGPDFNETLKSTYQKKEKLQVDKGQYSSLKIIYGQFIKKFEEQSPSCPICETNFTQKMDAVKKITNNLKYKMEKVPQQLARVEKELEKEETLYTKLQQLKFVNDEIHLLSEEKLPNMRKHLDEIAKKVNISTAELDKLNKELEKPQSVTNTAKEIISDVSALDQNQTDIDRSRRIIENFKASLVQVASQKSKPEVEAEIDHLKSEITEQRRMIDSQTKKITNHKDRLQKLTNEKSDLVQAQMNLSKQVYNRDALENQKKEFEEEVTILKDYIETLKMKINSFDIELENAIEIREEAVKKNEKEIERIRTKILLHSKMTEEIEKLQNEIDDYLSKDINKKITSTEQQLTKLKEEEVELGIAKTKLLDNISKKRENLAKEEMNFRSLKTNITLREKKKLENKLEEEIKALKTRIGGHNYKSVYEEKRKLIMERENIEKQINTLEGQKTSLKNLIDEFHCELSKPENKKAHTNYLEKFYELRVTENIIADLKIYVENLERAVIDFHKTKMTQINKVIRELWRDIYRGNDIDYIEIKTEHTTSAATKRTYNYKVVQLKRGVELDMRGRCSAGQKVLACLIIRMALAETLSTNCGILTLDEPTTNLDRENILSLSDTLCRIVNTRQSDSNFQLVIITHDEEFLKVLTRAQGVNYYYRVQRNNEGLSQIKREYTL